jgi:hypothetical protein
MYQVKQTVRRLRVMIVVFRRSHADRGAGIGSTYRFDAQGASPAAATHTKLREHSARSGGHSAFSTLTVTRLILR